VAEGSAGGPESDAGGHGGAAGEPERLAGGKLLLDRPADAVARLRIANPERRNALDHEILGAIAATLPRLDDGIATRCVLITGTPPLFSAGYDIAGFTEDAFEDETEALVAHPFQAAMEAIVAHPWPTVAAINGLCLGGGLELAVSCDLRIAAAGAKLGMPPAKLGLIYGHTGLRRFLETIGLPRTREMFFTGRNTDAARAELIGLVNEVVEDERIDEAGVELAAEIAAAAPLSTRGNKRVIDVLAANPVLSDAQEEELVELRRSCFGSADFREGIRAFAEKRRPAWTGE
jgi:enoyl-CoA hydratase/carnithine racemase